MEIELILDAKDKSVPLSFGVTRMVNAGYTGRNQEEVRRHIEELAAKGIPGPEKTPTLYPVICRTLLQDEAVEVYGDETCGEVEYVLFVKDKNTIYVGLGSDHTDRHLEETDIPRAKQICPNLISRKVWPLSELEGHWDELEITSKMMQGGEEILYQKGRLELIMNPEGLMKFVLSKIPGPLDGTVIYSGTIGSLAGGFVFGEKFMAELFDPKLNRRLELAYDIRPLDYMTVE